jgi:AP2 domain
MPKPHAIRLLPSQKYLRECFNYNPTTGVLTWKRRPREHFPTVTTWLWWNTRFANKPAGCHKDGYLVIWLGAQYRAHRIIFKLTTGQEPPETLDHKSRKDDNRWDQLRPATRRQQTWNVPLRKDNTSGFRGVWRTKSGKWQVKVSGRCLGTFDTREEAATVADAARRELHGEFYFTR